MNHTRRGTILIIVAGVCSLMATLALGFLARMRSDGEESTLFLAETQARVMFAAALSYVGETSRIGWDLPGTPEHEEAFGWVDIRDGRPGPRDFRGNLLFAAADPVLGTGTRWPAVGSSMICDARLWKRPPTAISANVAPNPILHEPAKDWRSLVGFPTRDPQPAIANRAQFLAGDPTPMPWTDTPCWFRVYRRKPAVFIITCGAGSSGGYRDWQEVQDAGATDRFGSSATWQAYRNQEPIFWYEVEWNAGVNVTSSGYMYLTDLSIVPNNVSKTFGNSGTLGADHPNKRNQMGTFLYLQRLDHEPARW
jgi:hypothetical protein